MQQKFKWGSFLSWYKGYEEKTHVRVGNFFKPGGGNLFKFAEEYTPLNSALGHSANQPAEWPEKLITQIWILDPSFFISVLNILAYD